MYTRSSRLFWIDTLRAWYLPAIMYVYMHERDVKTHTQTQKVHIIRSLFFPTPPSLYVHIFFFFCLNVRGDFFFFFYGGSCGNIQFCFSQNLNWFSITWCNLSLYSIDIRLLLRDNSNIIYITIMLRFPDEIFNLNNSEHTRLKIDFYTVWPSLIPGKHTE